MAAIFRCSPCELFFRITWTLAKRATRKAIQQTQGRSCVTFRLRWSHMNAGDSNCGDTSHQWLLARTIARFHPPKLSFLTRCGALFLGDAQLSSLTTEAPSPQQTINYTRHVRGTDGGPLNQCQTCPQLRFLSYGFDCQGLHGAPQRCPKYIVQGLTKIEFPNIVHYT